MTRIILSNLKFDEEKFWSIKVCRVSYWIHYEYIRFRSEIARISILICQREAKLNAQGIGTMSFFVVNSVVYSINFRIKRARGRKDIFLSITTTATCSRWPRARSEFKLNKILKYFIISLNWMTLGIGTSPLK